MPFTLLLLLAGLVSLPQGDYLREAVKLGRTQDDALFESFNRSYDMPGSGSVDRIEIITEFRRAVLIVRARMDEGDFVFGPDDLAKAIKPFKGQVTLIAQVRLHPQNTWVREPPYDLYVRTGPQSPPIAPKALKREPVYLSGVPGPGTPVVGVRLEASLPRAEIEGAVSPFLVVTDDKAEILWQARIDLSRYR